MAKVQLTDVNKIFDGAVHAVRDANLLVEDQEFVVLVGPSGCGKSTLLRMIAGLEPVTSGEIRIGDKVVNDLAPKDRDIAMVFQSYALYPHMNVFNNMALGLKLRKTAKSEIASRVQEAAAILGIEELLDRKPRQLSGGQRQRVAVGRAIVRKPRVFLFDEPLSNLDAKMRVQTRAELSQLHRRLQATILYVTHDQVEAMTMGNRIVIMRDGIVQQVGAPVDVYANPTNRFVAEFIGSPAMNLLRGRWSAGPAIHSAAGAALELQGGQDTMRNIAPGAQGNEVDVGVRPEDIVLGERPAGWKSVACSEGTVTFLERLGGETLVHVELDPETTWIVRMRGVCSLEVGTRTKLWANWATAHHFDPESGTSLIAQTTAQ